MENAPATFQTSRPSSPLFCHPDFLTSLETYRTQPIGKRAALLLQRLLIDPERLHYKATQGDNKGWRRSRLGGSSGSHFYAWWAPKGSLPLQSHPGFADAPAGSLFLRDIRHHDDHSPMLSQRFPEDYLPITVPEVRQEDFGPAPWTTQQAKFANARDSVRVLKGHPGSGKTTALLHAADHTSSTNILYLTYSADLASLARTYFDRYCSNSREYHVTTFPHFLRALLNVDLPIPPLAELRQRFRVEIVSQSRSLGPWANDLPALFDEFHAHVIGGALPAIVARFKAAPTQRMIEADYVARRSRSLGRGPAEQAHAAAVRLEKSAGPLAPRLFPDLHLAWTAIAKLPELSASALPWDCIAIDECQDLTPIESFFIARLALRLRQLRGRPVPVLVAGDEAQTVRPTDFEWAWLNDIFHAELATPAVHKLSSNLRSPRQIAELINSVWDLYGYLDKQDRPSGQGWAAIDDDSPDQILYCAAAPGEDLSALLADLSSREGLALVAFGAPPPGLPQALSPSEIKGLDFHSVCIIDGGEQLQKIVNTMGSSDIEHLSRRLAIDQLRVAISRPTERLIWLDISPPPLRVAGSISFLNGKSRQSSHSALSSAALLKSLQEENLDLEERIQRCQEDARQYLSIRPDLAWSRAHQAVTLLGIASDRNAVQDPLTRKTAHLTLAEVCFSLALRKVKLSPELGNPPLLSEASMSATQAGEHALSAFAFALSRHANLTDAEELNSSVDLMRQFPNMVADLPPWVLIELGTEPQRWIDRLEAVQHLGTNAAICVRVLPPFFKALGLPDAAERTTKLQTRAVELLVKAKHFKEALPILAALPERNYKLEAGCHEGCGDFAAAAEAHQAGGNLDAAIDAYRRVPNFAKALAAMRLSTKAHPSAPALEWIAAMQTLAAKRPANFNRLVKPEEKKLLEQLLESSLGVQRKAPAAKKPTAKKAAVKKAPPRKRPAPVSPLQR